MNILNGLFPALGICALITFCTFHANAKVQTNTVAASASDWYSESETHVETYPNIEIVSAPRAMIKGSSSNIGVKNGALNYTSSNPNVIQIDSNGYMTAISAGTATIEVSNPACRDSVSITVYDEETTDVALSSLPKKKVYQLGEELDFTGIELKFSGIRNYIGKWDAAIQLDGTWSQGECTYPEIYLDAFDYHMGYYYSIDYDPTSTYTWSNHEENYLIPLHLSYRTHYNISNSNYSSYSQADSNINFGCWIITSEFDSQKPGIYTIYVSQTEELLDAENTPSFTVEVEAPESLQTGDADGSGNIDILDVITINKTILGKEKLSDAQIEAADINRNGIPDFDDSLVLLKYIVDLVQTL